MSKSNQLKFILRNLQALLSAGVPLDVGLQIIEKKVKGKKGGLVGKISDIRKGLSTGMAFEQVLERNFQKSMSPSLKLFIKIGESSGTLNQMISRGLETQEKMQKIKTSLVAALSYPLFIFTLAMLMIIAMLIFIVPKITPMFRDLKVELPIYTKFLIFVSGFISKYFLIILLVAIVTGTGIIGFYKKSQEFQRFLENCLFKTPVLKDFLINYNLATISVCLSEYLKSGYSIHDSLQTISGSIRSENYSKACIQISNDLRAGTDLADAMNRYGEIMPNWADSVGFAVNSGKLPEQFQQFYIESSNLIDQFGLNLKRWSEPILILGIGTIVAFFAVSIISPIYGLVQHIGA